MFKLNALIVYPIHGVGKIKKIERKTIFDERKKYYAIEFLNNNIKIMVPIDMAEEIGVRVIIKKREAHKILKILKAKPGKMEDDWKSRYQNNQDRIKTGSIHEIARVVRDLYHRNKEKELSLMEKKMYENATNHLVLEISIAKKSSYENVEKIINKILP